MLSEKFLRTQYVTFSSIRRRLYQLGFESVNNSKTLWRDVDGSLYQIVNNGETAQVVPHDPPQKED